MMDPGLRIGRNRFVQAAYVVNDIDAAMERWIRDYGIGPFYIIRHARMEELRHRGRPVNVDASFAMAQAGPIQIELCMQHDDGPSCYRDMFAPGEEGFHHMCSVTRDYDGELAHFRTLGLEPAMEGRFGDMRFCYMDTRPIAGFMTEIIEDWEPVRLSHQMVADAAVDWDGADPVREL